MTAAQLRVVLDLTRDGMSATGVMIVMRRYHGVYVTQRQINYYLNKAGVRRPPILRGRVLV